MLNKYTLLMLEDSSGRLLQVPEKEEWFRRTQAEGIIWICQMMVLRDKEKKVFKKVSSLNLMFLEFITETRMGLKIDVERIQ